MKTVISFFTTFRSSDGKQHWAVQSYDSKTGVVTMMNDFKFGTAKQKMNESYDDIPSARFYIEKTGSQFNVIDRIHDRIIASFRNKSDAVDFCDDKNAEAVFEDAVNG